MPACSNCLRLLLVLACTPSLAAAETASFGGTEPGAAESGGGAVGSGAVGSGTPPACHHFDDDSAVADFAKQRPIENDPGITTCSQLKDRTHSVFCADLHGPYRSLRSACNATCDACRLAGKQPTCQDYGLVDVDFIPAAFIRQGSSYRSCGGMMQTYGRFSHVLRASHYPPEKGQTYYDPPIQLWFGAQGPQCPVAAGICHDPTRVPISARAQITADNRTVFADYWGVTSDPGRANTRDIDPGLPHSFWTPYEEGAAKPEICAALPGLCSCDTVHRIVCFFAEIQSASWIELGLEIPAPVTDFFFERHKMTSLTRAVGQTLNAGLIVLSFKNAVLQFIETGTFSHLTKLEALFGYFGHQGSGIPDNRILSLIHPAYDFNEEGDRYYNDASRDTKGNVFSAKWFFSGLNGTRGEGMPALRFAWLANQRFQVWEPDACCAQVPELEVFWIQDSPFADIPAMAFTQNALLRYAQLPNTGMTRLPAGLWGDNTVLYTLYLENSQVGSIATDAFPKHAARDARFQLTMAGNPSVCARGLNATTAQTSALQCQCDAGYVNGPTGGAACFPIQCPEHVQLVTSPANDATAASAKCGGTRRVGSTCDIQCAVGDDSARFTCGEGGQWVSPSVLDCQAALSAGNKFALLGQPLTFVVPRVTDTIKFDPDGLVPRAPPHNGANETVLLVWSQYINAQCILEPRFEDGSLVHDKVSSTVTMTFRPKPGRNERYCNDAFDGNERSVPQSLVGSGGFYDCTGGNCAVFELQQRGADPVRQPILYWRSPFQTVFVTGNTVPMVRTQGQSVERFTMHKDGNRTVAQAPTVVGGFAGEHRFVAATPIPAGLELDEVTGILSGTLESHGKFDIRIDSVRLVDGETDEESRQEATRFVADVAPALKEEGTSGLVITQNSIYAGTRPKITGGKGTRRFFARADLPLPPGLSVNSITGQITGTPTETTGGAEMTVGVSVEDENGAVTNLQTIGLTVQPAISATWSHSLPTAVLGEAFDMPEPRLVEDLVPALYRLDKNASAAGLSFDQGSGRFYGIPEHAGVFNVTITLTDVDGATAVINGDVGVTLEVVECSASFSCSGHGECDQDSDQYDGAFTCTCEQGWNGMQCAEASASEQPRTSDDADDVAVGISVALLVLIAALVGTRYWHKAIVSHRRKGRVQQVVEDPSEASVDDLCNALHEAIVLGMAKHVQALINHGAVASRRSSTGQLPHAVLLHSYFGDGTAPRRAMSTASTADFEEAIHCLFDAHCVIDDHLGATLSGAIGEGAQQLVLKTLGRMARENWRSSGDELSVAHVIFEACRVGGIDEATTIALMDAMLLEAPDLLTARNSRHVPSMAIAMQCVKCTEVQRRFTVVVFEHYQIPDPEMPLYKSPTAQVYEAVDLREHTRPGVDAGPRPIGRPAGILPYRRLRLGRNRSGAAGDASRRPAGPNNVESAFSVGPRAAEPGLVRGRIAGSCTGDIALALATRTRGQERLALKLIGSPDLWQRELEVREVFSGATAEVINVVDVVSAALVDTSAVTASDDAAADAADESNDAGLVRAAVEYARGATTDLRPITVVAHADLASAVHQAVARDILANYPYALCMPLADRNLREIIESERLADSPVLVIQRMGLEMAKTIQSLHRNGVVHGDIKPKNIVRIGRGLRLVDFDMSFKASSLDVASSPIADMAKLAGSTAYAAPELIKWMEAAQHPGGARAGPLDALFSPYRVDLWSLGATLFEMATSVSLFGHSYDRVTNAARQDMLNWGGLSMDHIHQIEKQHSRSEASALVDLLRWSLDSDPALRPDSIDAVLKHAFFDPEGGALREDFAVKRIRELLAVNNPDRGYAKVMISYCWADSKFVLGKLAPEIAYNCGSLWLDRLGGDEGMGEWAVESMRRGVGDADFVLAVVSPSYIKSKNCGREMAFAHEYNTTIVPVVLGVPFAEWPPTRIGQTDMDQQFATLSGDVKIFVDMTEPASFFTKLNRELLPRLVQGNAAAESGGTMVESMSDESLPRSVSSGSSAPPTPSTPSGWGSGALVRERSEASASSVTSSV